jgi:predicted SprT family Zn-dependent metalloprotease
MLQHEAAHIVAWRRHGEGIEEHGPEFLEICRHLVKTNPAKYCKKD